MILYQKSRTPYIIRSLFSVLTIIGLVLATAAVVVAYFAIQEHWPRAFGIWLGASVLALFAGGLFRGSMKENVKKIVLVEIIPNALKILELKKNEEEETIIPAHDLQIDILTHKISSEHRNGLSNRRVSYHLEILGKDNEKPPFRIYESKKGLVEMLENMEAAKIVTLKINEKELINSYRNPGRIGSLLKLKNYIVIAIIILVVIFMGAKIILYGSTWFSTTENVFPATWNVITPEGDSTGYLIMKSDSTFRFRGFNYHCGGSFGFILMSQPVQSTGLINRSTSLNNYLRQL